MNFVKNKFDFIQADYSGIEKDIQSWCDKEKFSKAIIQNSIIGEQNRVDSKIGEHIVSTFLGLPLDNTYKYDMTFGLDNKIEIKTKRREVNARLEYIGDIAATSQHQFHDSKKKIICFVSLNKLSKVAEICGFISVNRFLKTLREENQDEIKFIPKGTAIEKGYVQRADGWSVKYSCLMKPEAFKQFLKEKDFI